MRELSFVFREPKPVVALKTLTRLLSGSSIENRPQNPLTHVAEPGEPARLRSNLLHGGSDPEKSGQHGWPPLAWAARGGHLEAIHTSVRASVDFDRPGDGRNGWTPPTHAIHKGQFPIVCVCAGAPPPACSAAI